MGRLQHIPREGCRWPRLVQRLGAQTNPLNPRRLNMEMIALLVAGLAALAYIHRQYDSMEHLQRIRVREDGKRGS